MGEGASELIHIGQVLMSHGGTIDYFADAVFNFPTLAECYKTAALDGINRLSV
jgi:NAD(P) transhydrogenase